MSVIKQKSNWGYWDELDALPIYHGEKLVITYPDGSEQAVTAIVEETGQSVLHDGYVVRTMEARAEFEWHGAKVRLGLRGMEARRA